MFLTRYITTPVKIPLTKYVVAKDVAFTPGDTSWLADYDLAPARDRNILFLEMGTTNVPKGPWSNFTGGALQLAVALDSLAPHRMDFTEADSQRFRLINNFARNNKNDNPTRISGRLEILSSNEKEIVVTGLITFTTAKVATYQEIRLEKTAIPVLDLAAYVDATIPRKATSPPTTSSSASGKRKNRLPEKADRGKVAPAMAATSVEEFRIAADHPLIKAASPPMAAAPVARASAVRNDESPSTPPRRAGQRKAPPSTT